MNEMKPTSFKYPLKVLVVEDNEVDKKVIESMLKDPASSVSLLKITNNLSSAFKMLKEFAFDVIVLDLNLPDSKGVETLVKVNDKYPNIAIIVNTGAYEDELGLKTLSLGAQDFLVKGRYSSYVLNKVLHYCIERKRAEVEIKTAYEKLKETQARLIQSEKLKVVGGLASGIAHEVKNPLATILYGTTYLIEQLKVDDEKINLALSNIKEATLKANNIITDLLDFASMTKLNKQKASLNDILERSLKLINHAIEKNRITIIKNYDVDLPKINLDINRVEQVVINLILNAVYASPKGNEINIKTEFKELSEQLSEIPAEYKSKYKPGQKVVLVSIIDNGPGIPDEVAKQIFDPFFTTRRAKGGTGLGLSVSKNIMDIHKGIISIKNKKPTGAIAKLIFKA